MEDIKDGRQIEEDEILAVLEHDLFGMPGELRDLTDNNNNNKNSGCG